MSEVSGTRVRNISPNELAKIKNQEPEGEAIAYKGSINKTIDKNKEEVIRYAEEDLDALEKAGVLKKRKSYFEPAPIKFKLPSGNKIVDSKKLTKDNEIFVRRFAAPEEDILAKSQMFQDNVPKTLELINKALDGTIKTNISIYDLSLIDKMALLIFIFAITYGHEIDIASALAGDVCTKCMPKEEQEFADEHGLETNTVIIDLLKDLKTNYIPDDYVYPFKIKLDSYEGSNINITFEYPRIENEAVFTSPNMEVSDVIKSLLKDVSGTKPNGNPVVKQEVDDILKYLDRGDKIKIKKHLESFGDFGLKNTCNNFKCSKGKGCGLIGTDAIEVEFNLLLMKLAARMKGNE